MNRDRGFTLIELMIVVALMSITSALAIPNILSQLPKWHANGSTRDVMSKLMVARLKAIQNNQIYGVKFTPGTVDSYVLQRFSTGVWINEGGDSQTTSDVDIIPAVNCLNSGIYRATFNPNGTTGACNSIEIRTQNGTFKREITLSTNTGKISVKFCEKEAC